MWAITVLELSWSFRKLRRGVGFGGGGRGKACSRFYTVRGFVCRFSDFLFLRCTILSRFLASIKKRAGCCRVDGAVGFGQWAGRGAGILIMQAEFCCAVLRAFWNSQVCFFERSVGCDGGCIRTYFVVCRQIELLCGGINRRRA